MTDICIICRTEFNVNQLSKCNSCTGYYCNACIITLMISDVQKEAHRMHCCQCLRPLVLSFGESIIPIKFRDIIQKDFPFMGKIEIDHHKKRFTFLDKDLYHKPIFNFDIFTHLVSEGKIIWPNFSKIFLGLNSTCSYCLTDVYISTNDNEKPSIRMALKAKEIMIECGHSKKYYNEHTIFHLLFFQCGFDEEKLTFTGASFTNKNRMKCIECDGASQSDYEKHCWKSACHKAWLKDQEKKANVENTSS